jgi:hypothetical protein
VSILKALAALVAAVLSVIVGQLTDSQITAAEWVVIAIAFVNAINVWMVPNLPGGLGTVTKALVVVSGAVLAAVTTAVLAGGISFTEVLQLAVIGLQALLVYLVPNAPTLDSARTRHGMS